MLIYTSFRIKLMSINNKVRNKVNREWVLFQDNKIIAFQWESTKQDMSMSLMQGILTNISDINKNTKILWTTLINLKIIRFNNKFNIILLLLYLLEIWFLQYNLMIKYTKDYKFKEIFKSHKMLKYKSTIIWVWIIICMIIPIRKSQRIILRIWIVLLESSQLMFWINN